jgi:hypothetical protein
VPGLSAITPVARTTPLTGTAARPRFCLPLPPLPPPMMTPAEMMVEVLAAHRESAQAIGGLA